MLYLTVKGRELYDSENNRFIDVKTQTIQLEHSLVSISKWEAKWKKPFLSNKTMSVEETVDYIRCMTITQNVNPYLYFCIDDDNVKEVTAYVYDPMTATWFSKDEKKSPNRAVYTSEVIYWQMITLGIPFECQKWHLNRLLTLIRVCNEKNAPPKKLSGRELSNSNRALNAARRKKHNSRG